MSKKRRIDKPEKLGMWGMLRDVLIASMNKGQFPIALCALIAIVMILKMPSQDVSKLVFELLARVTDGKLVGYILAGFFAFGWFFHTRVQRRRIVGEMDRISAERNEWQKRALGSAVTSSEKR